MHQAADDSPQLTALRLEGAGKAYAGRPAVSPLFLNVARGETVAIIGPSGSGKTTLLNMLAGLIKPDTGSVYLEGVSLDQLPPGRDRARLVGIMHQQFDLVGELPVIHNVLAGRLGEWGLFRSLWSLIVPQETHLVRKALERAGIVDKMHQRTSRLSGGEQQRVALARLLMQRPRVILADEPVSSLDPARAEDLIGMLVEIAKEQEATLVTSLHSIHYARRYFSRIIGLRQSKVSFDLPADQVDEIKLNRLYQLSEATADAPGNH